MNTQVSAVNMQVRAVAEKGLLINEIADKADSHWDDEATAAQTSTNPTLLYPTSTSNGENWWHGASKKSYDAASAPSGSKSTDLIGDYEALSGLTALTTTGLGADASAGANAKREVMGKAETDAIGYYVHYEYYLKSAGAGLTSSDLGTAAGKMNIIIKSVTATPNGNESTALNSSLRVGIKLASTFYIYAPVSGYTASYYVATSATAASSTATTPKAGNVPTFTDLTTLPSVGTDGTKVDVYLWYEGEDANCKSDNATATTLDNIDVDIVFALDTLVAVTGTISSTAQDVGGTNYYQVDSSEYYASQDTYNANTTTFYKISGTTVTPVYAVYSAS